MAHATPRRVIRPERRGEALEILNSTAEHTMVQPGYIRCRIYGDVQDDGVLLVEEARRSEEQLDLNGEGLKIHSFS